MSWGTGCRFRHAVSGAYLSVAEGGGVDTTMDRSDPATVFLLVQNDLDGESRHVSMGSFVRVRHRLTGQYLVRRAPPSTLDTPRDQPNRPPRAPAARATRTPPVISDDLP